VGDLETVASRILGATASTQALREYVAQTGRALPKPSEPADRGLVQHVERALAASIGASSARVVLTHALHRQGLEVDEVAELLDETSQELRFSRQLLQATMENVTQGISVVDAQLRVVAWNRRYLELFGYPDGLVTVGRPVVELLRWNAAQGELGPGDPEVQVEKRLAHLRAGTTYTFQRVRRNGQVYSIHGQPMARGGFVTTYTDITDFKRHEQALLEAKQGLEERVAHRTRELSASLEAQRLAKQEAEAANMSKTRFFAAASHDLLQPLNAARLFVSALESQAQAHPEFQELASRIDDSMRAAEELLNDLLDSARLDSGALKPDISSFPIVDLLEELRRQYAPLAQARNLRLRVVGCREVVRSDRSMLRRIVQNYLSNGLRYTERGGVLLGCRRRGGEIEIAVYDTGPGIALHQRQEMYAEFSRLEHASPWGEKGLGLGLSICHRLAKLMQHSLSFASHPGRGSMFGVRVVREIGARPPRSAEAPVSTPDPGNLQDMRVLCVDNDCAILDGMEALLGQWGVRVLKARNSAEATLLCGQSDVDIILADYHLEDGVDGIELLRRLRKPSLSAALVSADHDAELMLAARSAGFPLLHKPLRPAALRALLCAFRQQARNAAA
jgi:PAS domain S-box-containing protein